MDELYLKFFSKFPDMPKADAAVFLSYFEKKTYAKNSILLREGEVSNEAFIILKGSVRQYFSSETGIEKTCSFTFEGEFFTDLESFSRKSRSSTTLITLEPTECLVIKCTDLVKAIKESVAIAELCRIIVENIASENNKRIQSLLSVSPEGQFKELIRQDHQIIKRIPQRYIAQYLGLAPESLSRIRKRINNT